MHMSTAFIAFGCVLFLLAWCVLLKQAEATSLIFEHCCAPRLTGFLGAASSDVGASTRRPHIALVPGTGETQQPARDVARALSHIWLFSGLNQRQINLIAQIARRRCVAPGDEIVRQGSVDDGDLFCVLRGYFKVTMHGSHGQEIFINILQAGESFGEIAFLDKQGRSATVTALEEGELLMIRRDDIDHVLHSAPKVAIAMLTAQARLVRNLTERAEDNAFLDVPKRLAKRLIALADHLGTPLDAKQIALKVRLSQQDLGDMVQASRSNVHECLREWAQQGLIRADSPLVIIDRQRLENVAAGVA